MVTELLNELNGEAERIGALRAYKSKFAKAQQNTLANGVERIQGLVKEIRVEPKVTKKEKSGKTQVEEEKNLLE